MGDKGRGVWLLERGSAEVGKVINVCVCACVRVCCEGGSVGKLGVAKSGRRDLSLGTASGTWVGDGCFGGEEEKLLERRIPY